MMKRIFTTLLIILTALPSLAQESNTYKGVVVNKDKTPVDVFSVVVFNTQDSAKQLYANTFSNGDFSFEFTQSETEKYGVYLLAMGYSDTRIPLEKMRDTVTLHNNSMRIDDVVVQGKRKVSTSIGEGGGVLFDVSNTYLSNIGESTQLLNFIPGVKADKDGNISLIGNTSNIVVYINNIMQEDPEKLRSVKSEDVKSVEVIRMPGAKYKNADAVILIRTNRAIDGMRTNVGMEGYISDKGQYSIAPTLDISYTKNRITLNASYRYNTGESLSENKLGNKIGESSAPGGWSISNNENRKDKNHTHWYSASLDYIIDDKNIMNVQYNGKHSNDHNNKNTEQIVSKKAAGSVYGNFLNQITDSDDTRNTAHLYYKGTFSPKFNLVFNADYSNKIIDNNNLNTWILDGESTPKIFTQPTLQNANAFTAEAVLSNTIKEKHTISYGAEYAYITNSTRSSNMNESHTLYKQNSYFLKAILEYKTQISKSVSLSLGTNYMYSKVKDNNTSKSGDNYNSIIPYLAVQYYNQEKNLGISFNAKYNNDQPAAGLLDDSTIEYISPYQIKTGNKNLKNSETTTFSLSFNYKNFQIGAEAQILKNYIFTGSNLVKIQENGDPLIINTTTNLNRTVTGINIYTGYSNKFRFWTPSIYLSVMCTVGSVPQADNIYTNLNGWRGFFYLTNYFELPKKFSISLNAHYGTNGYGLFLYQKEYYSVNLSVEKRFLKDQLRIAIDIKGVVANKWNGGNYTLYDVENTYSSHNGWYRHIGLSASWRFNNHKAIQNSKDNEYLNML